MKGITYQLVITLVQSIFSSLFPKLSDELRNLLKNYINDLYAKACATPNPIDDMFVEILAAILAVPLEKKQ
jgi:hypothetical protein